MVQYIRSNTSSDIICGERLLVGFRGLMVLYTTFTLYGCIVFNVLCS